MPFIAAIAVSFFFWLSTAVFAESQPAPASGDDLTYLAGRVAIIVAIIAIAVAAVYNAFRKASIAEWKELAEARKGKLVETELENAQLRARVRNLEDENENLEKKNLRLQDGRQ